MSRYLFALAAVLGISSFSFAITASNVLVLYNASSPDGLEIANYYAQKRPGARLLGLTGVPTSEEITQDIYRDVILPQVRTALTSSTSVLVTTKGLPLRIYNDRTPSSYPFTYTDPQGTSRTIYSAGDFKRYSSLESELTRVATFSTWTQMGDQTWWYPQSLGGNPSINPYFGKMTAFSEPESYGQMRLSTRLDGYNVADVKASIDRAQNAIIVPKGHKVIVDDSPNAVAATSTHMGMLANYVLAPRGQSYVYDNQVAPVLSSSSPVIGYVSHGTNDGSGQLNPGYMQNQLQFTLANGAITQTWESYNGYTFTEGAPHSQGLIADWLRKGGTGGIAHVEEPIGSLATVTSEDKMFAMLLNGYTWAEAAWAATPQVSYVNTVIGDPLMIWRQWIAGDANLDGTVNLGDYARLRANWLLPGTFDKGDFNGDGIVNLGDYGVLRTNWLRNYGGPQPLFPNDLPPPPDLPEPSAGLILAISACFLGGQRIRIGIRTHI